MINPAFIKRQEEAALLGTMVVGYGELDLSFASIAGMAIKHQFAVLEACHKVRSERGRLDIAIALSHEAFEEAGLKLQFCYTTQALGRCLRIRNQYAHAQWGDVAGLGLCMTNPENSFQRPLKPTKWQPVPLDLLTKQEAFFENTRKWIIFLEMTLRGQHDGRRCSLQEPPKMPLPNLHTSPRKSGRSRSLQAG